MGYQKWFKKHSLKHKNIIKKLQTDDVDEIIEYFSYDNLKVKEPDFCPLFVQNKKCHDIDDLNCYFCGCPFFRFNDNAKILKSRCETDSRFGRKINSNGVVHQDCSFCLLPHKKSFIKKYFDYDWSKVMEKCDETD